MLARRFTIVCLMTTLFGMGFAILVTHLDQSPRRWQAGHVMSCGFDQGSACQARRSD